ncbi:unnamed protein product [Prunus armeniaca]
MQLSTLLLTKMVQQSWSKLMRLLRGCLFAMELGLVFISNWTQRNLWTTSMTISEWDNGVCTPFSLEFAIIITTSNPALDLDAQNSGHPYTPPHLCLFSTTMVSLARQQVPNAVCWFGWL